MKFHLWRRREKKHHVKNTAEKQPRELTDGFIIVLYLKWNKLRLILTLDWKLTGSLNLNRISYKMRKGHMLAIISASKPLTKPRVFVVFGFCCMPEIGWFGWKWHLSIQMPESVSVSLKSIGWWILRQKFIDYHFYRQWKALNQSGIEVESTILNIYRFDVY